MFIKLKHNTFFSFPPARRRSIMVARVLKQRHFSFPPARSTQLFGKALKEEYLAGKALNSHYYGVTVTVVYMVLSC